MNIFPGIGKSLGVFVIALAAIWAANNVGAINRIVGPRNPAA